MSKSTVYQIEAKRRRLWKLEACAETAYALLDAYGDGALLVDRGGVILAVNHMAAGLLGRDRASLLGASLHEILPPETARAYQHHIHQAFMSGEAARFDESREDGRDFVHCVQVVAGAGDEPSRAAILSHEVRDRAGDLDFLPKNREVNRRKRAEEALRLAEARYRSLFENTMEGIFQAEPDGRIITANPALARNLGYDSAGQLMEEVSGLAQLSVRKKNFAGLLAALKQEGSVSDFELEARQRQGGRLWLSLNAHTITDRDGRITGFEGVIVDISNRKRREMLNEALGRINETVSSTLELDEILNVTVIEAARSIGCETAGIVLRENRQWVMRYCYKLPPHVIGDRFFDEELPYVSLAALTRKPVTVNDTGKSAPGLANAYGFKSFLAVPLVVRDQVIGIISFNHHSRAVPFDEARVDFASKLAASVSLAVENARVYQNELADRARIQGFATQLSTLHDISLSLNRETDPDRLVELVLGSAAELTFAGSALMVINPNRPGEITSTYQAPWLEADTGASGNMETLRANIARVTAAGSWDVARFPEWGILAAAVRDPSGQTHGYIILGDKGGKAGFTGEDEEIISLLATQCSVALASAEMFERERHVAEVLQAALLPAAPARRDVELGLVYRSAGPYKVGGDFYDFVELGEDRMAVVLGDVCGKGLDAATYTAMIKYMLRAYLSEGLMPADCLTRLNRAVYNEITDDKFITVGLALLDSSRRRLDYASAGHPRPALCQNGRSSLLETDAAVPLGVTKDAVFISSCTRLPARSYLLMYTDGLIEARPEAGGPYGEGRLLDTLGRCCGLSAQQMAERLLDSAVNYTGGRLRDDIALVALRPPVAG